MAANSESLKWNTVIRTSMKASTPHRTYWIHGCPDGWHWLYEGSDSAPGPMSLEAAKAACQADFDRTVRECIETETTEEPTQ